jgi:hypothetical protein
LTGNSIAKIPITHGSTENFGITPTTIPIMIANAMLPGELSGWNA